MSPRILVVYVTAGAGHRRAAEAVARALTAAFPQAAVECQDLLRDVPGWLQRGYPRIYHLLVQHLSPLWGGCFEALDRPVIYRLVQPIRHAWNALMARGWAQRLGAAAPDLIIATHFFPADVVSGAMRRGRLTSQLLVVITDLYPHRFWLSPEAGAYVVGSEETARVAAQRGILAERLHPLGIPIADAFESPVDRPALLRRLALEPHRRTVLVTSGGTTVGPFEPVVRSFMHLEASWPGRLQLLVVCGDNARALQRLTHQARGLAMPVRVFGFVDTMAELMGACDLVVAKAGGMIVTEALGRGLPLVFYHAIPGQERLNARYVTAHGAGIRVHARATAATVRRVFEEPGGYERMQASARTLSHPHAAQSLVSQVVQPLLSSQHP